MKDIFRLCAELLVVILLTWRLRVETSILSVRVLFWRTVSNMLDSDNRYAKGLAEGWMRVRFLVWLWFFRLQWTLTFSVWYPIRWRWEMWFRPEQVRTLLDHEAYGSWADRKIDAVKYQRKERGH